MIPEFLSHGEPARLIPIVAESNRERRVASVFLAVMTHIPPLAANLLRTADQRIGKRTKLRAFTEVVFPGPENATDRPDGLLVLDTGQRTWRALFEMKVGSNPLDHDKVRRYAQLAKDHGIDAVITLSNELTARAGHHPVVVPKIVGRRVSLFHWPWKWVLTQCELLEFEGTIIDQEQRFLLHELIRFLEHASTGVESFSQMNPEWRDVVKAAITNTALKKGSPEIENTVGSWHQEQRDLCLILAKRIGAAVNLKLPAKFEADAVGRAKSDAAVLAESGVLTSTIAVPNAADSINVIVDLKARSVTCSIRLIAPQDRKSTTARLNWLLRQLSAVDPEDILVRAIWPGRAAQTTGTLSTLRENPVQIQAENAKLRPTAFEVQISKDLAGRFSGRRTFIEEIEKIVPEFYTRVGANLKTWQPSPPQPRVSESREDETPVENFVAQDNTTIGATHDAID